jgi:choline transport protein
VSLIVGLLSLLNIGSTAAFGAIIALSSLALYFSYFIAISCMLGSRYSKHEPVKLGGWNLGRYGPAVNVFALVYTGWMCVFLPFPTTLPVDAVNMNYCGPIFGAVMLFVGGSWVVWGRKRWTGVEDGVVRLVVGYA